MKTLIVDNGTKYLDSLVKLTGPHNPTVKSYSQLSTDDQTDYDVIILSGGHAFPVVGHEQDLEKEINLIQNTDKPVLGICFGYELIAHSYGATLQRMFAKEKTLLAIRQKEVDPIFAGIGDITVYESHRWVVSSVREGLQALASSKDGIEIIKHKEKLIYGFQFHPEMFPDQTQGNELFANFMKIVQNKAV